MILDRDPIQEIKKAFKLFEDGSGRITVGGLRRVAKGMRFGGWCVVGFDDDCLLMHYRIMALTHVDLGESLPDEELQAMIDEFDLDGDGCSMFCFWVWLWCDVTQCDVYYHLYCFL